MKIEKRRFKFLAPPSNDVLVYENWEKQIRRNILWLIKNHQPKDITIEINSIVYENFIEQAEMPKNKSKYKKVELIKDEQIGAQFYRCYLK